MARGGGRSGVLGICPVLDPDVPVEQGVEGARDVAGGVDVGVGAAQELVDADAVVGLEAGGVGEVGVGHDPDPDDDRVRLDDGAVGEVHAVGAPVAAHDLGDLHAALQVDAVAPVQAGEDRGHLAAQDSQQRQLIGLEDGDRCAGPPGGGRDLQADPAGPDHDHAGLGVEDDPDPVAVLDGAQVVHAVQIGAGGRESPRRGAGGQQELGVADPAAVGQGHLVGGGVDCGGGRREAQVDVVVGVPPFGMDEDGVPASAALQVFLRQGRPFVGPVRLQEIAGCALPGRLCAHEADAPVQDVQGRFTGILVLVEHLAGDQGDQGLAQDVFVSAVHGGGAAATRGVPGDVELVTCQCGQRGLLHRASPSCVLGAPTAASARCRARGRFGS